VYKRQIYHCKKKKKLNDERLLNYCPRVMLLKENM